MKNLVYGNTRILVCDAVAYATIDYAVGLAQSRLADRVSVPSYDDLGCEEEVTVMLAPALPLLAEPAPDDPLADDPTCLPAATRLYVRDIEARTLAVRTTAH